jgi:hypothetical protein
MVQKADTTKIAGALCIIGGLLCNKFVIEALFTSDGDISALPVNIAIVVLQIFLIAAGVLYIKHAYKVLTGIGVSFILLVALQFWIRGVLEIPFPEKRMFQALPFPPSLFKAGGEYRDQISRYEARFEGIREMLPSHGEIGYITSKHLPAEQAKFHWGLTTYALSPLNVKRSRQYEFVVGNFPDFHSVPPVYELENFVARKDFGNGILLFQRKNSP